MISLNTQYNKQKTVSFGTNLEISKPIILDMQLLPGETIKEVSQYEIEAKRLSLLQSSLQLDRKDRKLTYKELNNTRYLCLEDNNGNKAFIKDPLQGSNFTKNTASYVAAVREGILKGYKDLLISLEEKIALSVRKSELELAQEREKQKLKELELEQQRLKELEQKQLEVEAVKNEDTRKWVNSLISNLSVKE